MSFTQRVVGRPTTVLIIFALLVGLGFFATSNLAVDLYPKIEPPVLLLFTTYSGAGPEEIEKTVTRPLEGVLSNAAGLKKLTSTSSSGSSMIMLEFAYGTDMGEASNSVRDNLELVKRYLPDGSDPPIIFKFDPAMIPILGLMVTGNRSPEELREIAEKTIQPRIEQVPGVALTSVSGGRERTVRVELPENRLEAYNLTIGQIVSMLQGQNIQIAAGSIQDANVNYLLTTAGEYKSIDEIKDTVIAYKGGGYDPARGMESAKVVRLRDVADVFDGYKDEDNLVFVNGNPAVQIIVQKQSGKNSVQTAHDVRARLVSLARELPQGVKVTELFNTTDIIENSIRNVQNSARDGAILAIIILFIFLRSVKPTFIIGLTIPISLLFTLMLMYFSGLTLNLMTLSGLALGIGKLLDDSIITLENTYRYREKGAKLTASAIIGTREMILAVAASTMTSICVFAPILMFKGELDVMGELFASLAFTVVISLATSLAVAMILVPVLASHYLPVVTRRQKPLRNPLLRSVDTAMARFFEGLDSAYRRAVGFVLRHKLPTVGIIAAIFLGSLALIPRLGFIFMPTQAGDSVTADVELPVGTTLVETEAVLKQLESIARQEIKGYKNIILQVGQKSFFGWMGNSLSHKGSIEITLPPYARRIDSSETVKAKLRAHFNDFPAAVFSFSSGNMTMGGFNANPIDVLVKTDDLGKGKRIADSIRSIIKDRIPEATEPTVDLKDGLPQVELKIDRQRMYALGLNIYSVGNEIKASIDGVAATKYRSGGSEYDILVILAKADRSSLPDLDRIFVLSPGGQRVSLASFATYEKTLGPVDINREGQGRVIHITAGIKPGASVDKVQTKLRSLISSEIPAEEDVVIEYSGDYKQLMEYGAKFALIMLVAVALVFGVMASLFESLLDPFIILFTIPLSFTGVIWIYYLTGEALNILTAVGVIVLVGIITNNGIVLVDYTNLMRKRGLSLHDACVTAAGNRLRPILMTTLATILGLVPMAFFPGEGSELIAPIGKTVVGGLAFGTLMTLFLMPAIYAIFNRRSEARKSRHEAHLSRVAAGAGVVADGSAGAAAGTLGADGSAGAGAGARGAAASAEPTAAESIAAESPAPDPRDRAAEPEPPAAEPEPPAGGEA
ncbi:MAG: efflux RND transporter permease subunit [Treponema sp.]|nr:efflux RND transporter permease subunit [Treponema sp.]